MKRWKGKTALCIAAHPDDEILGCGGTMAKLADLGCRVHICIVGEGMRSRGMEDKPAETSLVNQLQDHAQKAGRIVGAESVTFRQLPDNAFDSLPLLNVVKVVEEIILTAEPDLLLTHSASDLNIDHTTLHRAVLTAARPLSPSFVREIFSFEVLSSTEWALGLVGGPFRPNVFVDISESLSRKVDAMNAYVTESRPFPHPRSPEGIRVSAQKWGLASGLVAAEAFETIRAVWL